jgi:hypothetical protein
MHRAQNGSWDLFVDLSGSVMTPEGIEPFARLLSNRLRMSVGQRITAVADRESRILVDGRLFEPPRRAGALAHAIELAQIDGRGLFVISGAWMPTARLLDDVAALATVDPNIGTVQPRFGVGGSGDVAMLAAGSSTSSSVISRTLLPLLPELYVTPEIDAACTYITPTAVTAVDTTSAATGLATQLDLLVGLRRRGFRNLVANRLVADYGLPAGSVYGSHQGEAEGSALAEDARAGARWLEGSAMLKLERMLSQSMRGGRKRLLLDCRGMTPVHNGSAHAILGYLLGISRANNPGWEITVCVGREAADYHRLLRRFPDFQYEFQQPRSHYLVALHLSQPWRMNMLMELHESAPLIAFNILDTIAWDAIYPAPDDLDRVTRLAARFADGMIYLSEHSQKSFRLRFPPHDGMQEVVTYLSTSPDEYHVMGAHPLQQTTGILVMGNRLDHKDVARTTDKLANAFPFFPIVSFGDERPCTNPNVRTVPSGHLSDATVRDLLERASVIVYPSFAEGFGIPAVQGLSLGKHVVVRDLPLWDEIRALTGSNGKLRTFRTDAELVTAVGAALEPDAQASGPAGSGGRAVTWSDCGNLLIRFADELVSRFDYERWQSRDLAITRP